jgi:ubiquinone/menaquinone biosynthesis C-methylase UbiE
MAASHHRADATRAYYDEFSVRYDAERRPNQPSGYHALIDDLEVELVERYSTGADVLECGVGTGLLLERVARSARSAKGIDLSPGMLDKARARGLDVREASIAAIPFPDASFDVTYAFKVLAHVPEVDRALAEMARVTRVGGAVIAEFYNPLSFRGLWKRLGPAGRISQVTRESAVYTRFDAPWMVPRLLPPCLTFERARGVRIVTPVAAVMKIPGVRTVVRAVEWFLADTAAATIAGFYVAVLRKTASV